MTDTKTIGEFLESPDWSESDKWVIKWQYRMLGGFETALKEAICHADYGNLTRLALGFPIQVRGYVDWTQGNLARRFRDAGLNI
jgi:hypothetical protein